MFFNLIIKEIKYQFKSITPYLLLLIILLFYFSQYGLHITDSKIAKPHSEMQFMQTYMQNLINKGVMSNITSPEPIELTVEQVKYIEHALEELKKISVKDQYDMFQPSSKAEYANIMNKLDSQLGYDTNFHDKIRPHFLRYRVNYGSKEITNNHLKMLIMFNKMISDYHSSSIYTYPIGFAKKINLTPAHKQALKDSLNSMIRDGDRYLDFINVPESISFNCSYEQLNSILNNLDKSLGGGSYYGSDLRKSLFYESKSYLEAQEDYESIVKLDKISNAYARLYADYMGITAGLFPIFLAAFVFPRDKKNRMKEIINTKQFSSFLYVTAKFIAIVFVVLLFYLITATMATVDFIGIAKSSNLVIDNFAFYSHTLLWVLPTVMFVIAVGMLLSVIFKNGVVAIPIQFILCYTSIMPLSGNYSLSKFIIRCNAVISYNEFKMWSHEILFNRLFYILLSLILIGLTSLIWSKSRSVKDGYSTTLFKSS